MLAVGYSVNAAQLFNARSQLIASLDSALTSVGRDISTGVISVDDADEQISAYLIANGGTNVSQGNTMQLLEPPVINKAKKTIQATAFIDVDAFMPFFGDANRTRVVTTAGTLYTDTTVEVALMLDVTGSMGEEGTPLDGKKQTKLDNLKTAATNAVANLLSRNAPGRTPRVRVAIIPYSQSVNAGKLAKMNYVENNGLLGILPIVIPESPMSWPLMNDPVNVLLKATMGLLHNKADDCTTERKVWDDNKKTAVFDTSDNGPSTRMVSRDKRLGLERGGNQLSKGVCPTSPIVPLTADEKTLADAIKGFKAGGYTAGQIGIQWTRYLLSPKWADELTANYPGSAPTAYNSRVKKIAILMTDGEFNTAYAEVPADAPREENPAGGQSTRSSDFAKTLCRAMKDQEIEVFTIGFMLDTDQAMDTMEDCASTYPAKVQHFYAVDDGAALNQAFEEITRNMEKLQLTN